VAEGPFASFSVGRGREIARPFARQGRTVRSWRATPVERLTVRSKRSIDKNEKLVFA